MSKIRFSGTPSSGVSLPPLGKAFFFYDGVDGVFKGKLDDGTVVVFSITEEYIQDIVGGLLDTSSTIGVNYDDPGNVLTLEILANSINSSHINTISPLKIVDSQNQRYQGDVITNNNSPTLIQSLDCSVDGAWLVEAKVVARRIGGLLGAPGDGAVFRRTFRIKSIGSSVTIHDVQSDYTSRDVPTLNVSFNVLGTDVEFYVAGLDNNNIKWNIDLIVNNNS
jgi:hypothetical protein